MLQKLYQYRITVINELDNIDDFKCYFNTLKQSTELLRTFLQGGGKFKVNINKKILMAIIH